MSKRFAGYMLVTDMDGTLLNSGKMISPENKRAIERFVEQGGMFTLATGRIAGSVRRFADVLPLTAPAILYNGAMMYDFANNEVVWQRTLPEAARRALQQVMDRFPGLGVEIYCGSEPYYLRENEVTDHHRSMENFKRPATESMELLPEPWIKVLLAWNPAKLDEVEAFTEQFKEKLTWVRSDDKYLEILPENATKGHALEELMAAKGIERAKCIAMGDHLNDLEMLRRAGVGIAVANAHASLTDVCDRTCKHHDDHAVADVIEWLEREAN
ncbi:HAD family hydrolase [Paenibacillus doosanensis]|uniref:HAD family hydrolase n=1 Tax=Paenibacillus doosanensis TaxID=1229154 RepID=UPI0021808243|nr:HAD family hydrolase [Paenibacillus doosanensis]MCS7459372.1 HAD family hydrolase [Paenibacillus doosanensis]